MTNRQKEIINKVNVGKLRQLLSDLPKRYPEQIEVNMGEGEITVADFKEVLKDNMLPCWGCLLEHYLRPTYCEDHKEGQPYDYIAGQKYLAEFLGLGSLFELNLLLEILEASGEPYATSAFHSFVEAYMLDWRDCFSRDTSTTTLDVVIKTWHRYANRIEELQKVAA